MYKNIKLSVILKGAMLIIFAKCSRDYVYSRGMFIPESRVCQEMVNLESYIMSHFWPSTWGQYWTQHTIQNIET